MGKWADKMINKRMNRLKKQRFFRWRNEEINRQIDR
jgi:hypothetical protein